MAACSAASVQTYYGCEAPAFGAPAFNANDPNLAAIQSAVNQSVPAGIPNRPSYLVACEAMLRAGVLFYQKSTPGDCGAPNPITGVTSGQIAGLSGQGASVAVEGLGAAGIIGGAATMGITAAISVAVAGIESIFAHHTAAVANEQATLCSVMNFFNAAKRSVDNAVRSGQITPDAGVTYFTQVANQAKTGLSTIVKVCNAACWYIGYLNAFIFYSRTWYDSIAPTMGVYAQAPGGPPTTYGTPPGGVTSSPSSPPPPPPIRTLASNTYAPAGPSPVNGTSPQLVSNSALPGNSKAPDYLNLGYNQQTGDSAQAADTPSTFVFPPWLVPIMIVIAVAFILMQGMS